MRILSGIQPSGILHIGNYFGMMRPAIALQAEGETFISLPIIMRSPACAIRKRSVKTRGELRSTFWPAVSDPTAARFSCKAPSRKSPSSRGSCQRSRQWVARARAFLQRQARPRRGGLGRLVYISRANGSRYFDLRQRHCAGGQRSKAAHRNDARSGREMNEAFGEIFKLPEPRIRRYRNSARHRRPKMSKSYGNAIDIFGDENETRKRVMSIVTDSLPVEAPKDPGKSTIFHLLAVRFQQRNRRDDGKIPPRRHRLWRVQETAFESSGNISRRCVNATPKSPPTKLISAMSSRAAPSARIRLPIK